MAYRGTLLLVSHDREFLDHVATSCFVFAGGGEVMVVAGGYEEASRALKRAERARTPEEQPSVPPPRVEAASTAPRKLSYKETRELEALPGRITELEAEIAAAEGLLSDPVAFTKDAAAAQAALARLPKAREELDAAETRWLELSERA